MCIVYGQQVWIMPLFKAVPLQLVDRHSLPSVLCAEETVSILESEETVWEKQCALVHTTRTRAVRTLLSAAKHYYFVWVEKESVKSVKGNYERKCASSLACRVKLMCRGTGQLIAFGPLVGRVVSAENATGSANTNRRNQCTRSMNHINTLQQKYNNKKVVKQVLI